jgi:hypothetical protein
MIRRLGASVRGALIAAAAVCLSASVVSAQPCLIFVHGKQTNTNTFTSYASARNYWINGSHDAVKTATKNFAASYYVVGYNGTQPWWGSQSAGEVANEIVAATNGVADGRHACARTFANGGTFWVVDQHGEGIWTTSSATTTERPQLQRGRSVRRRRNA